MIVDQVERESTGRAVLGTLMLHGDLVREAQTRGLGPLHFPTKRQRTLFKAMLTLSDNGTPIDFVSVGQSLRGYSGPSEVFGSLGLPQLAREAASRDDLPVLIERLMVAEKAGN